MLFCTNKVLQQKGFTLIEMMISVGIFVVISGVVLANYNGFNSKVLLSNLAYDLALTIRQAQTYGISVRGSSNNYTYAYGVYMKESAADGSTSEFVFFSDNEITNDYDDPGAGVCSGDCIKLYGLTRGNKIDEFCVNDNGTDRCSSGSTLTDTSLSTLTIMFKRPNPDTIFRVMRGDGTFLTASDIRSATITIVSPKGDTKTITVRPTGQISVN